MKSRFFILDPGVIAASAFGVTSLLSSSSASSSLAMVSRFTVRRGLSDGEAFGSRLIVVVAALDSQGRLRGILSMANMVFMGITTLVEY